jgi:hypothetical protein
MGNTRTGWMTVVRETTAGTAVKPSKTIPYKDGDFTPKIEIKANNPIKANRWNALNVTQGKISVEGSHKFDFDPNFAVWWLSVGMGTHTVTTVSSDTSAFKHTLTMNQIDLPTLTVEQMKGGVSASDTNRQGYQVNRSYGTYVDEFEISGSDDILGFSVKTKSLGLFDTALLTADVTAGSTKTISLDRVEGLVATDTLNIWKSTPSSEQITVTSVALAAKTIVVPTLVAPYTTALGSKVELVPVAASFPDDDVVFSFFHCQFQEGADITAAASAGLSNYEDWTLTYMNQLEDRYGSLRQSASVIAAKGASAKIKYTKYFTDVVKRDQWRNTKPTALIITMTNGKRISATDTNITKYSAVIKCPNVVITSYEMPTGTDDLYAESIEAEVFYDKTAGYAIQFEVTNSKANTYYGV